MTGSHGYKKILGPEDDRNLTRNVWVPECLKPVYKELPGWKESTYGAKIMADLPDNARAYIRFVEDAIGAPIDIISTGPDRLETIVLRHSFDM